MLFKNLHRVLAFLVCLAVSASVIAGARQHRAAHIASPGQYTVLHENEHVLVLKMVLKPGESDSMHRHHNETVYFQRGGSLNITLSNGEGMRVDVPDGHVMWHEAWTHQVKNVGGNEVVAIIVESKPS